MTTSKGLESQFKKLAPKYFANYGFELEEKSPLTMVNKALFENKSISYIQMGITTKRIFSYRGLSFRWSLNYPKVEHFWFKYRHLLSKDNDPKTPTIGFLKPYINESFIDNSKYDDFINNYSALRLDRGTELIENWTDFEEILNKTSEQYSNTILSHIDNNCDLQWLDSIINSSKDYDPSNKYILINDGHLYRKIIVARMTGNSRYNELVNHYKEVYRNSYENNGSQNALNNFETIVELDKDLSQYNDPEDFEYLIY
ncbi:hypothetical protein [Olleya sp. HaHaR_3_96]|uniref:hypothetical protein n=1 Tax=Olleya sp. HaHaR_3_96 TaxID=2745560 RepID=UPI001C4FFBD0|nr:hypothetical protein [Olleya sp. HaHaR_3_96]QXP59314.1 hypothetical protein H0I26_15515 [Olleya sp. HaHaR_3_96]